MAKKEKKSVKKSSGIHWMHCGDNVEFHIGSRGKLQTMTIQKFYSHFPKEPKHGILDKKWSDYSLKNDEAGEEFRKKYS